MAPSTRSNSAQNSPVASKASGKSGVTPSTTPSTTPRKQPRCTKCKRVKEGHPRSGCPFVNAASNENATDSEPLTDALGSMKLASPARVIERDEDTKAFIRNRRRSVQPAGLVPSDSLLSLSTNSSEIVARLLQPGMFDNNIDEERDGSGNGKASRIVRWQETIATTPVKKKTPGRSPMPGTLIPPSPDSSFASSHNSAAKEESPARNVKVIPPSNGSVSSSSTQHPKPLTRSMSAMERDIFVSKLAEEACATIYIIPKADVQSIQAEAAALKFITHPVMNDDENDGQALLILGRDELAVQGLLRKVEEENKKATLCKEKDQQPAQVGSTFKAAAGGAVVGAVGAWAGLAFS